MDELRFGVYEYRATDAYGILLRKQMIVLRDSDGNIVGWTNFHKYARSGKHALSRSIYSGQDKRCIYVSLLLNYVFFEKYHIAKLTDIEPVMVKDFLTDYGLCHLPNDNKDTRRARVQSTFALQQLSIFLI